MRRREFIAGLGGAAAWPLVARAQQTTMPVIGFLSTASPDQFADRARPFHPGLRGFRQGLAETGYVEGRNLTIEYRWAEGHNDRLPALAAELVRRQVAVIAAPGSTLGALAAKALTTTIPIVFATGVDPVKEGLVASLPRPGGNVTGVTTLGVEVGSKQLQVLHELVPAATALAVLVNPANPPIAEPTTNTMRAAARTLGIELHVLNASTERDLDVVFATLAQLRLGGIVIGPDLFFGSRPQQLAALAFRHAVPAIFYTPEFAAAGGLMSYGGSLTDLYRLAGVYTGRILKGEKPADLPVQQATKVEMAINLKTAKALGLTIPETLLVRADEVIE
jgi:putative tryptophan/tyrosine transport system substrate-binding protein